MAVYPEINVQNLTEVSSVNDTQQQKWVMNIACEAHEANPFHKFLGGYRGSQPILEVMDTRALHGQEIILHSTAPLGGFGVQSDQLLIGKEEKRRFNNYKLKIGALRHAIAFTEIMAAETVIGSVADKDAAKQLANWQGWRQGWDTEMEMLIKAHNDNTIRANGKLSYDSLGTGDYLSGETLVSAKVKATMNQAKPIINAKYSGGSPQGKFVCVAPNLALESWQRTTAYQSQMASSTPRSDQNALSQGNFPDFQGTLLYPWEIGFGTQYGPIGSASVAVAKLGEAVPATDVAITLKGGGDAKGAALTYPQYFAGFANAPYTGFEGEKKAAIVNVTRYALIKTPEGKFGFVAYQVNNGNQIIVTERLAATAGTFNKTTLTGSSITWNSGAWTLNYLTSEFPVGSEVWQCNAKGVPVVRSYVMGDKGLICGYGAINNQLAMGRRIVDKQDYENSIGIGIQTVWGVQAVPRTDKMINGYVVIESGYKLQGMPDVN